MCSIPATAERAVARSHFSIRQNPHAQLTGKLFLCSGGLRCFWSARNNYLRNDRHRQDGTLTRGRTRGHDLPTICTPLRWNSMKPGKPVRLQGVWTCLFARAACKAQGSGTPRGPCSRRAESFHHSLEPGKSLKPLSAETRHN